MLKYKIAAAATVLIAAVAPMRAGAATTGKHCASGYHLDKTGHCQPNTGARNRYCPPGYVYHAAPRGWRCKLPDAHH